MKQQLELSKRVSLLFLCLPDEWAYQVLQHMTLHGMRTLIGHLNLLQSISLYDCEAALIDVLEVLLREEEKRVTEHAYVIEILKYALPEQELPVLMQEISTDRKTASQIIRKERSHALLSKHTVDLLRGIRLRLLDGIDLVQFRGDHFYKELLHNLIQKIDSSPALVAQQLEAALFQEPGENSRQTFDLSGRKKAALAVLQMGKEAVEKIFQYMAPAERQALAFEMVCLGHLGFHEELLALMDYMELLLNLKLISQEFSYEVQDMLLVLQNDFFAPIENWTEREEADSGDAAEILELFAPHLFDEEERGMLTEEEGEGGGKEREVFIPNDIREKLIEIGLEAAKSHPRLVARAIRYLFKQ